MMTSILRGILTLLMSAFLLCAAILVPLLSMGDMGIWGIVTICMAFSMMSVCFTILTCYFLLGGSNNE